MGKICCGHFNFKVQGNWLLCQDCEGGIAINSAANQRLLDKKRGAPLMNPQQQAVYDSLVESYKELIQSAGTIDSERLADWANKQP